MRHYVIQDNQALFFATRDEAEEYQEDNYYLCSGDVRQVPEYATHYKIIDGNLVKAVFIGPHSSDEIGWRKIELHHP